MAKTRECMIKAQIFMIKVSRYVTKDGNDDDDDDGHDDGLTNLYFQSIFWINETSKMQKYRRITKVIFRICRFMEHNFSCL